MTWATLSATNTNLTFHPTPLHLSSWNPTPLRFIPSPSPGDGPALPWTTSGNSRATAGRKSPPTERPR